MFAPLKGTNWAVTMNRERIQQKLEVNVKETESIVHSLIEFFRKLERSISAYYVVNRIEDKETA